MYRGTTLLLASYPLSVVVLGYVPRYMYELVLVGPVTGNSRLIMIVSSSQHVPTPTRGEIYDDELGLALLHEGRPLVLRFDELHVFDGSWGEFFYELVGKFLHVLSNNRASIIVSPLAAGTPSSIWRIGASLAAAPSHRRTRAAAPLIPTLPIGGPGFR